MAGGAQEQGVAQQSTMILATLSNGGLRRVDMVGGA